MLSIKSKNFMISEEQREFKDFPEPIELMEYKLTERTTLVFEGFDKYIRLKENVMGVNTSLNEVTKVILMGASGKKVVTITIDTKTGEFKQELKMLGKELNDAPINPTLWKKGVGGRANLYLREEG